MKPGRRGAAWRRFAGSYCAPCPLPDRGPYVFHAAGRTRLVDGPFAEAKEMMGGFFLLNCKAREEPLAIAVDCPAAGLGIVDARALESGLAHYPWLPSVRGDLLSKLGRHDETRAEFERAAGMTGNQREREMLLARAQQRE
jgi:hypothetical protein